MRTLLRPLLVVAAASTLGLAACGSDDDSPLVADDLDGTTWNATTVEGYELAGTLTMSFDDGRLSVTGGCNNLGGAYTVTDGRLSAGPLVSTMMACPDALMDQDAWIGQLLEAGSNVAQDGDELVLTSDDVTITLQPVA